MAIKNDHSLGAHHHQQKQRNQTETPPNQKYLPPCDRWVASENKVQVIDAQPSTWQYESHFTEAIEKKQMNM